MSITPEEFYKSLNYWEQLNLKTNLLKNTYPNLELAELKSKALDLPDEQAIYNLKSLIFSVNWLFELYRRY